MENIMALVGTKIEHLVPVIENQLYFAVIRGGTDVHLKTTADVFCFSTDEELTYQNYYYDFGPLNISCVYKYCCKLNKCLQCSRGLKKIVHYTSAMPDMKANAAFLMGCFAIIYLKMSPRDATKMMLTAAPYKHFLDASQCPGQFEIKLSDTFNAIAKAMAYNFFNFEDFNEQEYDIMNRLQYGDMNWLLPRKFLALIGPSEGRDRLMGAGHPPDFYLKYFLKNDIKIVIRLNDKAYDENTFIDAGIEHFDLIFPDGTTPPKDILLRFLDIAENTPTALAVHCKAGLGRTGSLIGAYIMKHFRFSAREVIAWLRICRPGCVIGQQQIWLEKLQQWLWRSGIQYRIRNFGGPDEIFRQAYGIYSKQWPLEREKIVKEAQARYCSKFIEPEIVPPKRNTRYHRFRKRGSEPRPRLKDISNITKLLSSVHGLGDVIAEAPQALTQQVTYLRAEPQAKVAEETALKTKTPRREKEPAAKPSSASGQCRKTNHPDANSEPSSEKKEVQGDSLRRNSTSCYAGNCEHTARSDVYCSTKATSSLPNRAGFSRSLSAKQTYSRDVGSYAHGNGYAPEEDTMVSSYAKAYAARKCKENLDQQGDRLMYIKVNRMRNKRC